MSITTDETRIGGPKPTSQLIVRPDQLHELGVYAMWVGSGQPYTLHWGDGATTPMTPMRPPANHVYASPGRYLIRGVVQDEQYSKSTSVEVPWPKPGPKIDFRAGHLSVGLRFPANLPTGTWRIHWPDWDPEDITHPTPGEWIDRPAVPGQHTLRVVYVPDGTTSTSPALEVSDTDFAVHWDTRIDGRTVTVHRTDPADPDPGYPGRPWQVFWGDEWTLDEGSIARQAEWLSNDTATHTYPAAGTYVVEISSSWRGLVYYGIQEVTVR